MIVNGSDLARYHPVEPFEPVKTKLNGVSYGLSEAGYDIRIKQDINFYIDYDGSSTIKIIDGDDYYFTSDKFCIASSLERFKMPTELLGIVHDKSTWARKGLSVFNTVIEPGWEGYLTLELVYHGQEKLTIPAGSGIAQVIFHQVSKPAAYNGKYQNQEDKPVEAIFEQN